MRSLYPFCNLTRGYLEGHEKLYPPCNEASPDPYTPGGYSSEVLTVQDGVSTDKLLDNISTALGAMFTEKGRWADLAGLHSLDLNRAIERKLSLTTTTGVEYRLAEALEACGFYSTAAQLYAEAARYLHNAAHPSTSNALCSAGLAWKRDGDFPMAESYYALSLQSQHFQHDCIQYKRGVFNTLRNLYLLYYDPEKNFAPFKLLATLKELLEATGEMSPDEAGIQHLNSNDSHLRGSYRNMTQEQACRVIQSIIAKSETVETMREAILSCANPSVRYVEMSSSSGDDRIRQNKDDAREFIRGTCKTTGFITTCDGCGEAKEEKSLELCSACKKVHYCSIECQKAHWPQHKACCKAARKTSSKKKKKSASSA